MYEKLSGVFPAALTAGLPPSGAIRDRRFRRMFICWRPAAPEPHCPSKLRNLTSTSGMQRLLRECLSKDFCTSDTRRHKKMEGHNRVKAGLLITTFRELYFLLGTKIVSQENTTSSYCLSMPFNYTLIIYCLSQAPFNEGSKCFIGAKQASGKLGAVGLYNYPPIITEQERQRGTKRLARGHKESLYSQQENPGVPAPAPCFSGIKCGGLIPLGSERSVTLKLFMIRATRNQGKA